MDNGASVSVFQNKELLTDIKLAKRPIIITGVAKEKKIVATKVGKFNGIPNVYLCPEAAANLLSFSATGSYCDNSYDPAEDAFYSTPYGKESMTFSLNSRGLYSYIHEFDTVDVILTLTVDEIKKRYSSDQIKRATEFRELTMRLAYPTDENLLSILRTSERESGSTIFNKSDVINALDIYGKSLGSLRGKSTRRQIAIPTPTTGAPQLPISQRSITLHVDLFFVLGSIFLLSVSDPIALRMVTHLGHVGERARSVDNVTNAVMKQIYSYHSRGFVVSAINSDGEGAIKASKLNLETHGVVVNIVGPGAHVPKIERSIRVVKERVRSIIQVIHFNLPGSWVPYLVRFVTNRINMFLAKGGIVNTTPYEAFNGRPVSIKNDVRLAFGEYVEVTIPETNNSMSSRTRPGIALGQTDNTAGSGVFFSMETLKTFGGDLWTSRPMPTTMVTAINTLARRENAKHYNAQDLMDFMGEEDDEEAQAIEEIIQTSDSNSSDISETVGLPEEEHHTTETNQTPDIEKSSSNPMNNDSQTSEISNPTFPEQSDIQGNTNVTVSGSTKAPPHTSITKRITRSMNTVNPVLIPEPINLEEVEIVEHTDQRDDSTEVGKVLTVTKSLENIDLDDSEPTHTHHVYHMSVKEAHYKHPKATMDSLELELQQMIDKEVFEPIAVSEPLRTDVIRSFMFMKEKFDANGEFVKLKARLVADGSQQSHEEDVYAPTVRVQNFFSCLIIAAMSRQRVRSADVPGAYLLACMLHLFQTMILNKMNADILIRLDNSWQQYQRQDGTIVVRLRKALYGCIESAKLWYELAKKALLSEGFVINPYDHCIFNKDFNGKQCTTALYVDDFFLSCESDEILDAVVDTFKMHFQDLTVSSGQKQTYIGMSLDLSQMPVVTISMNYYISEFLKNFLNLRAYPSPATEHLYDIDSESALLTEVERQSFHSLVAKLLYLSKRIRPDLLLATSFLSTRVTKATLEDVIKLRRVAGYLMKTQHLTLQLCCHNIQELTVTTYIDASYGIHPDGKSHTGMAVTVGGGCIIAKSTKQKIVTKSSTEAELVALSDQAGVGMELGKMIYHQIFGGNDPSKTIPVILLQDNLSTMALINNGKPTHDATKHIPIRYFWVKERLKLNEIILRHCPTEIMIADILTKPLQGVTLLRLRDKILRGEIDEET
jgi:hypothetical protein